MKEMKERCTAYIDQIFDLKQKLASSLEIQSKLSAQSDEQKVLIEHLRNTCEKSTGDALEQTSLACSLQVKCENLQF